MVEDNSLFDVKDESKLNEAIPLVSEPYTYENMVANPIIKPIAETDRSLRDLEDMEYKKLVDVRRLQLKINAVISDVPSYQDSSFITDLIKLSQNNDDVIRLQEIMINLLKTCIKNMHKDILEHYGVRLGENEEYVEPTSIIPEGSIAAYLDKMSNHRDEKTAKVAQEIKELFIKTTKGRDDKDKYENATIEYYSNEVDKEKRKIAALLRRMEIQ
jgi:hypothetical protein